MLFVQSTAGTPRTPATRIITDAQNDDLPNVSFVTPDTHPESDHPPEPLPTRSGNSCDSFNG